MFAKNKAVLAVGGLGTKIVPGLATIMNPPYIWKYRIKVKAHWPTFQYIMSFFQLIGRGVGPRWNWHRKCPGQNETDSERGRSWTEFKHKVAGTKQNSEEGMGQNGIDRQRSKAKFELIKESGGGKAELIAKKVNQNGIDRERGRTKTKLTENATGPKKNW